LAVWIITMASQPRYSRSGENGSAWLFVLLPALAAVGGFLAYRAWLAVGLALGLPGLVLSPFTTPRGDNDGLWILIVPMMLVLIGVMCLLALTGAGVRTRLGGSVGKPAGRWAPDPTSRHEYRYFDGSAWTDLIADAGVEGVDPLT